MQRRTAHIRRYVTIFCFLFFLFLCFKNAQIAADGIKKGLVLCYEVLVPSLFPFLVLSELFISCGAGEVCGRLLHRPLSFLFGISGGGATALLTGWICGAPVGAVVAMRTYQRNEIDRQELGRLLLFCNMPSAGFLINTVGTQFFGNMEVGVVLFIASVLSCAITGFLLHCLFRKQYTSRPLAALRAPSFTLTDLTGSVRRAFSTLLGVLGFIIFFASLAETLSTLLTQVSISPLAKATIYGILEITSGINAATLLCDSETAFLLCAFFVGFSGLSIALQIFSVTEEASVPLIPYLFAKFAQGLFTAFLGMIYLRIRKPILLTSKHTFFDFSALPHPLTDDVTKSIVFICLALLLFGFVRQMVRKHKKGEG